MMNEMKKMKTLTLQGIPFEVVDEAARNDIESVKDTLENLPKNEIVTPDLAQNDPTAPDYVKNRTHYEETAEKTVEVVEEALLEGFPAFEVGDTVTLKVDGTEYSLVAFEEYGSAVIGDAGADLAGGTGEFGWVAYCEDSEVWFFSPSSNHTVGFTVVTVHKLDKKYLPDDDEKKTDKVDVIWENQYSNKTFDEIVRELNGRGVEALNITIRFEDTSSGKVAIIYPIDIALHETKITATFFGYTISSLTISHYTLSSTGTYVQKNSKEVTIS